MDIRKLRIGSRLAFGFGVVLSILIAMIVIVSTLNASNKSRLLTELARTTEKSAIANSMRGDMLEMAIAMRNIGLLGEPDLMNKQVDKVVSLRSTFYKARDKLALLGLNDEEKKMIEQVSSMDKAADGYLKDAVGQALAFNADNSIKIIMGKIDPETTKMLSVINSLAEMQDLASKKALEKSVMEDQSLNQVLWLCGLAAVAIGAAISWMIGRSVTLPITRMQTEMTQIASSQDFSRRVQVEQMDEVGLSMLAFNAMIQKIEESSEQLKQKTADIQAMMQNIPQGILTIHGSNKVHPEYSAHLAKILETDSIAGRDVIDLIFSGSKCNAEEISQVEAALVACVGEDAMNFEFNVHLLRTEVEISVASGTSKILDLSWAPIFDSHDNVASVMLCVRDVTELRQLAAEAGAQKRELDIIGQILAINQEKFHEFIDSSAKFLSDNKQILDEVGKDVDRLADSEVITQLFRNMHTIKGNARTYGLLHLTNLVHEAEQTYDQLRKNPNADWDHEKLLDQLGNAFTAIQEYAHINEVKLGRKGPGRRGGADRFLMVEIEDVKKAIAKLDEVDWEEPEVARQSVDGVRNSMALLGTSSLQTVLSVVLESIPSLAKELGKAVPASKVTGHGVFIKNQAGEFMRNMFMHLYRNSVDHGIETVAERKSSGKSAAGTIYLEAQLSSENLLLRFRDDGRGLALGKIRDKAIEKGILRDDATVNAKDLAQLIFHSGFSTAEKVTEVSGRGVGMDAVKNFVEKEGGKIQIVLIGGADALDSAAFLDSYQPFETVIILPTKFAIQSMGRVEVGKS